MQRNNQDKRMDIFSQAEKYRQFLYKHDLITIGESCIIKERIKMRKRDDLNVMKFVISFKKGPYTWKEISEYLLQGYKVRHKTWPKGKYIGQNSRGFYTEDTFIPGKYIEIPKEIDNKGWFIILNEKKHHVSGTEYEK